MPRLSASLDYNPTKPSRFEGALPPPPTNLYEYQNKGLMEFAFCKRLILKEMFSDGQTGHWAGKTARNPKCLSLEVSFRGLNKVVDYTRALVGGPWPLHRSLWECNACGDQWPESTEKPPNNFLIAGSSILMIVMAIETLAVMLISVIVWR